MKMAGARPWLRACFAFLCVSLASQEPRLTLWCRDASGVMIQGSMNDAPMPVGSLQKPFVAEAWAATHEGDPPRIRCGPESGCWLPAGHGELGLAAALARSCNTYYRVLAAQVPLPDLGSALEGAGFTRAPRTPGEAIGLPGADGPLRVRPSSLLAAYARLVKEPWNRHDEVRGLVLAGLREAALDGTAKGIGRRGFWAKTGTVPSPDGNPLHTCGLALAVDDTGWALLARLDPGTGREAAMAMADALARLRPWSKGHGPAVRGVEGIEHSQVRVRLFDLLGPRAWEARNLGPAPVRFNHAFLGPGGATVLHRGDQLGPGLLELRDPESGARRRLQGRIALGAHLVATMDARAYVEGVVAAELPNGAPALQEQLGAAVLRFLAHGPRHKDADVCDNTHCAWFVGRGPRLEWHDARHALAGSDEPFAFGEAAWDRIARAAHEPGPSQWTAHCGGEPLSPHAIWGGADRAVTPCPRHDASRSDPWSRQWRAASLSKTFGGPVESLAVTWPNGVWTLRVKLPSRSLELSYDEAHRRLAAVLGWDAMPSPADRVEADGNGFTATGRGSGHRVGLCLGE
ncbi:MAG: hypothetical protein JST05_07710 [Acidobacteria bacterium]|nr:hypothetical protein [Acidobacteriota bacterium]